MSTSSLHYWMNVTNLLSNKENNKEKNGYPRLRGKQKLKPRR